MLPSSHEEVEEGEVTLVHRISPSPSDEDDEVIGNMQVAAFARLERIFGQMKYLYE